LPVLDDGDSIPRLIKAVGEETPRNRAAAAHAMRTIDDPRLVTPLRSALGDPDPWVRYFRRPAAWRVAGMRVPPTRSYAFATADPAPQVRIAAVEALALLDARSVLPLASAMMREADDDIASATMGGCGADRWCGSRRDAGRRRAIVERAAV
jgi:HEAT repeat protein